MHVIGLHGATSGLRCVIQSVLTRRGRQISVGTGAHPHRAHDLSARSRLQLRQTSENEQSLYPLRHGKTLFFLKKSKEFRKKPLICERNRRKLRRGLSFLA